MKRFLIFASLALCMLVAHVGHAQDESPGKSVTIENQNLKSSSFDAANVPAVEIYTFSNPSQPECKVNAFVMPAPFLASQKAISLGITDYGSRCVIYHRIIINKKYFTLNKPVIPIRQC